MEIRTNKKVLLRERKRHTARRVSSARYAGGGTPSQVQGVPRPRSGGVPCPRFQGVSHPRSGGYPVPGLGGYPIPGSRGYPIPGLGEYPIPGLDGGGVPHPDLVRGVPPPARPGMGYPPAT